MNKLIRYTAIIVLLAASRHAGADVTTPAKLRRICKSGNDNTLFWFAPPDTCKSFKYYIWARKAATLPYEVVDSILDNAAAETYTHVGANAGPSTKNWSYFIESIDTCGPTYSLFSDTMGVDLDKTSLTFFDSVSVDPLTNKVHLGWRNNPTPDFKAFQVFNVAGSNYKTINGAGKRDTFLLDTFGLPASGALTYDIFSIDSCDNRDTSSGNLHTTIFLQHVTDTCARHVELRWSAYKGWPTVRKYYVYKSLNSGAYVCIDSVAGNVLKYTQTIPLGEALSYFIRAFKDEPGPIISSASNSVSFLTRGRIDPANTVLANVSVRLPEDESFDIQVRKVPGEETKRFEIQKSEQPGSWTKLQEAVVNDQAVDNYLINAVESTKRSFTFRVVSYNLCNEPVHQTEISTNIVASVQNEGSQNSLFWNTYFSWVPGVAGYKIYRGTGESTNSITFNFLDSASSLDSVYTDSLLPARVGNTGVCYYVMAVQSLPGTQTSNSNITCHIGDMSVFVPNAFNPSGYNRVFRPGGSFIDYTHSSMQIFDRWGEQIVDMSDLSAGWDGTDADGQPRGPGVYLYKMTIKSVDGKEEKRSGTVTLLR